MFYLNELRQTVEISSADEKWLDDRWFGEQTAKLPEDAPRAALAYRVSTKGQVDHDDIPMQKIECRKFCVTHGWRVVLERAEKGVSGSKVSAEKRDVIQEYRALALKSEFDILLVFMFDRLGRIESETPFVLEWFVEHGIEMWSVREGRQRIENHNDKLMNYLRFWQAAGESEKTSIRVCTRKRQIISSGHYTGGAVPFGYRAVNKGRVNKNDKPVKDLEIEPDEAEIVKEIFRKVALEGASGYALARELNERGVRTHSGSKFQTNNILRIIRHRGYLGYIWSREAQSEHIPELQIIDEETFNKANEVIMQRSINYQEARRIAKNSKNTTLLAGLVYCAHCGARMSGFMHNDRYKLADGSIRERTVPKYNCFQRGQNLRECDGQSLYKADIVDGIVLDVVRRIFGNISAQPKDETIEKKIKDRMAGNRKEVALCEKRVNDTRHSLETYEQEVLKCIEGKSSFSKEMLSRLISKSEAELKQAKIDLAKAKGRVESEVEAQKQIKACYSEFLGWAEEFELASLERKRMILAALISRVELGKGYQVRIQLNVKYQRFVGETQLMAG